MADLRIKICGITQPEQAIAITQLQERDRLNQLRQVSALGFICVEKSPRYIAPERIGDIVDALKQDAPRLPQRIGVFAKASLEQIQTTVEQGQLSGVQLHGDESLEFCQQVRQRLAKMDRSDVELIKAIRVRDAEALDAAQAFATVVDTLLLDAYHPQILGGTGHTLDWAMLQAFAPGCPWLLAGGLKPGNIATALETLNPAGIDLSSGVEHAPGDKDIEAVQQLLHNIAATGPSSTAPN